ncbi:glycoside hydrolase superfamily [Zychaea mexicana]|uniref:glycoside hydrolase superfamily n=1 Tax=Zychaea mexicana TaxID=64656 RepID=UPI0022FE0D86|nr:glycoside hydrolase superfamily [Zychaea mexicana]KAI9492623.1 glycoside hydrolase superfamily [Zychaea mexicana]
MTVTRPYETLLNFTPSMAVTYIHHSPPPQEENTSKTTTFTVSEKDQEALGATSQKLQHLTVDKQIQRIQEDHFELTLTLKAHDNDQSSIEFRHLEFSTPMDLMGQLMMADGFQCWTHTREMDLHGRLPPISKTVAWWTKFNLQGDYDFFQYSGAPGVIHSNSYTYLRDTQETAFVGSLSEESGYTYFKADYNANYFRIYKDIDGLTLASGETLTLRFMIMSVSQQQMVENNNSNTMDPLWQRYAAYYSSNEEEGSPASPRHLTGWTSWYNYYERVTEADVVKSLQGFIEHKYPIDVFQIDDGYQRAVGDWLDIDTEKFPRGMHYLSSSIKEAGYIPGLWLAPFAVGFTSKIVKEHPDWLIKNKDGSLLVAGPNWGGFYALDMYHPEARDYLRHVFDTVLHDWGYGLLKLDFIFAEAMIPRHGKSRGQILWESVQLIDELTQKRALILGSGVPLAATWQRFEYNRVSSDASPFWDHTVLRLSNVRERVATNNALTSTLHRWPMKHMFGVDPDVYFLRSNDNKLTPDECYTTCMINSIIGHLTLMSDDITQYDANQHRLYASTFPKIQPDIQRMIPIGPNAYRLDFQGNGRRYVTLVNLSPMPFTMDTLNDDNNSDKENMYYFEHKNIMIAGGKNATQSQPVVEWVQQQDKVTLKPHETRTFLQVTDQFAGSSGHIVPGWEIESWQQKSSNDSSGCTIHITLRQGRMPHQPFDIFMQIPPDAADGQARLPAVFVDDKPVVVQEHPVELTKLRLAKITIE